MRAPLAAILVTSLLAPASVYANSAEPAAATAPVRITTGVVPPAVLNSGNFTVTSDALAGVGIDRPCGAVLALKVNEKGYAENVRVVRSVNPKVDKCRYSRLSATTGSAQPPSIGSPSPSTSNSPLRCSAKSVPRKRQSFPLRTINLATTRPALQCRDWAFFFLGNNRTPRNPAPSLRVYKPIQENPKPGSSAYDSELRFSESEHILTNDEEERGSPRWCSASLASYFR